MKVQNCEDATINFIKTTIYDEDHTLGNMVRAQLLKDKTVKFAGDRRPHPLQKEIEMQV